MYDRYPKLQILQEIQNRKFNLENEILLLLKTNIFWIAILFIQKKQYTISLKQRHNLTPIVSDIPFSSVFEKLCQSHTQVQTEHQRLQRPGDRRSSYHKRVAKGEEQRGNKDIKVLFELHPKRDQIDQGALPISTLVQFVALEPGINQRLVFQTWLRQKIGQSLRHLFSLASCKSLETEGVLSFDISKCLTKYLAKIFDSQSQART